MIYCTVGPCGTAYFQSVSILSIGVVMENSSQAFLSKEDAIVAVLQCEGDSCSFIVSVAFVICYL